MLVVENNVIPRDPKGGRVYEDVKFSKYLGVTTACIFISLGLATEVPKLTHYWVVWFHPRAFDKVTSRFCPFIVLVCYVIATRVSPVLG